MEARKIVLAYSGGLDTSVLLKYLQEKYRAGIIAVTADVGEGRDLDEVRERALRVGAIEAHTLDLQPAYITIDWQKHTSRPAPCTRTSTGSLVLFPPSTTG